MKSDHREREISEAKGMEILLGATKWPSCVIVEGEKVRGDDNSDIDYV